MITKAKQFLVLVSVCGVTSLEYEPEIINEIDLANNKATNPAGELTYNKN